MSGEAKDGAARGDGRPQPLPRQEDNRPLPLPAVLQTVCLCILFGANAVAVKISLAGLGVFTTAGIRFSVAAAAIMLWARISAKPLAVSGRQLRQVLPLGLIFFCQLSLFYLGLNRTTASHGTLIVNGLPFVIMIMAHYFLPGDSMNRRTAGGLLLGFSGVLLLFYDTFNVSTASWQGDLLVFLAIVVWSSNAVYMKRIIGSFHPAQITCYPMAIASPLFLVCGLLWDAPPIRHVDVPIVSAMLYQTFVTASFGMVVWSSLIKRYGATTLHAFVFIMPLSGVSFGVLLLGEPLSLGLGGAIILVTAGLIVVNRKR